MKAIKPMLAVFVVTVFVIIMIPAVLVLPFSLDTTPGKLVERLEVQVNKKKKASPAYSSSVDVAVYRSEQKTVEELPIEKYIVGVVAAEMPAEFEMEALKAQALTARTYIVSQLVQKGKKGLPEGADVTDTIAHQVYRSDEQLKKDWGSAYDKKIKKVTEAVNETAGQILTYKGNPITATFFSTSNGYTEDSEDYWGNAYPYLKSVASPWDKISPKFYGKTAIPVQEFERKLGVMIGQTETIGTIIKRTSGKRVGVIEIGGKQLTGKQIRELLGLRSSDFGWERKGNEIVVTTKGYGHGVGMSQYGANGMALEGKNYKDIVKHYYKGVAIQSSNPFLNTMTAKK
ncbi:stage II sporulation protein D [Peribacillus sp. SCS-155]|uniref:stage II sporulation protein D n=1 Tax=Peribacillus sedimenti TaxID=3115297 RepID=UPI0039067CB7